MYDNNEAAFDAAEMCIKQLREDGVSAAFAGEGEPAIKVGIHDTTASFVYENLLENSRTDFTVTMTGLSRLQVRFEVEA